jgi:hypothetical protein
LAARADTFAGDFFDADAEREGRALVAIVGG